MKHVLILLLTLGALAGCSKESGEGPADHGAEPIVLNAEVAAVITPTTAGLRAFTGTRATIGGTTFPAMAPAFFLTAMQGSGNAAPVDWSSPYFSDKPVNSDASGKLSWPDGGTQYYPADKNLNVWFYAYSPRGTGITAGNASAAPAVTYDISDGQQDIIAAHLTQGVTAGQRQNPITLNFTHKLMQVRFAVKADASFEPDVTVTNITVKGTPTTAVLDIATGTLTASGSENVTAYNDAAGTTITTTEQELTGSSVMIGECADKKVRLDVTAGGIVYNDIEVILTGDDAGKAGTSHLVTLTFKRNAVSPSASITAWGDGGSADADWQE